MIFPTHHLLTAALALVLVTVPSGARAQEVVQPLPGTTDADRLGDTMRQLASNPRNVDALVRAGDLSIGLGDLSGAAALFARAEKVDPRNGRVKAGMASILVRSERPGEALRYFAQAEAFGLQPRYYAADRGLAYDLIGEQDRAQRDYRVALRDAPDDETVRRYALSLGISGKRDLALQQLDPLVLKKDRGAWRARAFILAMNNDVRGAETIVTTMMPGAAARGLQPFFQRLPLLAPADRAFAVHFGEVHATPQRIADARMTPVLPQLGADPTAPVMLAAAEPQLAPQPTGRAKAAADRSATRRDKTARSGRVEVAAVTPTPTPAPTPAPTPSPVRPTATVQASAPMVMVQPLPKPPVVLASTQAVQRPTGPAAATTPAPSAPTSTFVQPLPARTTSGAAADANRVSQASVAASTPTRAPDTPGALPSAIVAQMAALPTASATTAGTTPPVMPRTTTAPVTVSSSVPTTPAAAGVAATTVPATPAAVAPGIGSTPTQVAVAAAPAPTGRTIPVSEDSILARIIAGLSIPASELGVAPIARAAPVVPTTTAGVGAGDDAGARALADAKAKAERDTAAEADALAATRLADAKAARAKLAADKKIADRKAIADRKLAAEKKAAADKKAIADKAAAEEKRIARANPERIWVQVSTGATEGDLPKAWKGVKAKAPTVVGTRGGWTAPWGATNRVLAGPFKTAAEARTFVNALAKEGVSTFSFTSDAGQVVTKLPAK
ncbi:MULTISPECIES: tetratricopeptide repeat protein [unclassified Sphingomonas]|uniref:tetratricopeptide repeat protein n=1 Tax=unclassified Sphingomonas TaxID=196159 RepID=UPI0006F3E107|nr:MULTISPECIES: SPOR domain-containing protein [unclassified Sphingomonas]KQN14514.1 hypothetical protein ASE89_12625 [Sphingomonas sp. Leaf30]MBD8550150.1 SPOR domain-containing protein [Sphingomonas sp. CFBP 8764]